MTIYSMLRHRCITAGQSEVQIAAPSDLAAITASDIRITLSWMGNDPDAKGYKIERRAEDDSSFVFMPIMDLATSYSDTGLISDLTCHYRVSAYQGEAVSALTRSQPGFRGTAGDF